MYSIVLATMLTASTTTPAFGKGCFGCYGCHGCYGCYCCGGCYGCYGCYGCSGCYGCCGGYCCGGYCCGGSYCYGCYGYGCYGYGAAVIAVPVYSTAPVVKPAAAAMPTEGKVIVEVPQDAALFIDGQRSKMTSDRRTFVSPVLQPGETYFYDLKAEVVRDGQKKTETRRVTLRAGQIARVDFRDLGSVEEPVVSAAPAVVTVRLPDEARLLIDGKATPMKSNVRKFETPALAAGKTYYYMLTAELERDGETLSQSQQVIVKAGKKVAVSFDQLKPVATRNTASR